MADIRAEQIITAVVSAVTGLTTTGENVIRGRTRPVDVDNALSIYMGTDNPVSELQTGIIDWDLEVIIESHAQSSSLQIDTQLNLIRKEVHLAIMADYTMGLPFVQNVIPGMAAEPDMESESGKPTGTQRLLYTVKYRASRNDLSA